MHRIFVAIPLSGNLQESIHAWQRDHDNFNVRWQKGKNLHITLVPPRYVEDYHEIIHQLSYVQAHSFEINFHTVSLGPNSKNPRLIWAEGEAPREIINLRLNIIKALQQELEQRDFKLHVTLARFNQEQYRSLPVKELRDKVSWYEQVNSFVLMETHSTPQGSDYEILQEFKCS